jgi:cytochrome c oxidase cbb3-type subunit I/II
MWFATRPDGTLLYPDFMETVVSIRPAYIIRAIGGSLYLVGFVLMIVNVFRSIAGVKDLKDPVIECPALVPIDKESEIKSIFGESQNKEPLLHRLHGMLEGWPIVFAILAVVAILIGGALELVPMIMISFKTPDSKMIEPYTPLELEGRALYLREGCYNCHSQQVRPLLEETKRYGPYSRAFEYMWDKPFQWGSKRTGPDLHRIGRKYPDSWHFRHMQDPRTISPKSIMPSYSWMIENKLDTSDLKARMKVLKKMGVPYSQDQIDSSDVWLTKQANEIALRLKEQGEITGVHDREIIAMIAYLQRLGTDAISEKPVEEVRP